MKLSGRQVAAARELLGLGQGELATLVRVARRTITRVENNETQIKPETLALIQAELERRGIDAQVSITAQVTVAKAIRDNGTPIVRIRHGEPALDVTSEVVGTTTESRDYVQIVAAADGVRAIHRISNYHQATEHSELALLLPNRPLGEWVPYPRECGENLIHFRTGRDPAQWIINGACEVTREPLAVQLAN
jgi:transcriptional regulator with XRE-family HTH domain